MKNTINVVSDQNGRLKRVIFLLTIELIVKKIFEFSRLFFDSSEIYHFEKKNKLSCE
jgi:hypothetical protein